MGKSSTEMPSTILPSPPQETEHCTSYRNIQGFTGRDFATALLTADGTNPLLIAATRGNIYLTAGKNTQLVSETQVHRVETVNNQYYGSVKRTVEGSEKALICGENPIHVNGDQTVDIVGDHTLNVAGAQTTTAATGQSIIVKEGGRKVTVQTGDLKTTVSGIYDLTVDQNDTKNVAGGCFLTNGSYNNTVLGDNLAIKLSRETSVTLGEKATVGAAAEVSIAGGLYAKLSLAQHAEFNCAAKIAISSVKGETITSGISKSTDLTYQRKLSAMGNYIAAIKKEGAKTLKVTAKIYTKSVTASKR